MEAWDDWIALYFLPLPMTLVMATEVFKRGRDNDSLNQALVQLFGSELATVSLSMQT